MIYGRFSTDVRIKWHGVPSPPENSSALMAVNTEKTLMGYGKPAKKYYRQAPEKIPPIFDGSQLLIFGVFENPDEIVTGCTITADSPDGLLSIYIQVR